MTKPFTIDKHLVKEAFLQVKRNAGSAGVDNQTISDFEANLKPNLYKIWNRMSSGSYFPPPVKTVAIPKKQGGLRLLGIPTVADRISQMVVKMILEPKLEPYFLDDSYGYRPNKSALEAIAITRKRCWFCNWVLEFDIVGLFDNIPHNLLLKAVHKHTNCKWTRLYIKRWLEAPVQDVEGKLRQRNTGIPQGGVISPLLSNLFMHYVFDLWMTRTQPEIQWSRYADDGILHCKSKKQALYMMRQLEIRFAQCGIKLHKDKTKIVYCKRTGLKQDYPKVTFNYLGYTFKPRRAINNITQVAFTNYSPGVSQSAISNMIKVLRKLKISRRVDLSIAELAKFINPKLQGWINYYAKYTKTAFYPVCRQLNIALVKWAMNKYKSLKGHKVRAINLIQKICKEDKGLFAHWRCGMVGTFV